MGLSKGLRLVVLATNADVVQPMRVTSKLSRLLIAPPAPATERTLGVTAVCGYFFIIVTPSAIPVHANSLTVFQSKRLKRAFLLQSMIMFCLADEFLQLD